MLKKILVVCLVLAVLMSVSATAFAASNGFVKSPSGSQAPTVEKFEPENEHCMGTLVITSYGDRKDLPTDLRDRFEDAYDAIVKAEDMTDLNDDLAQIAADQKIDPEYLEVLDLFNVHIEGCDTHDGHFNFDITISTSTLDEFVALLHMNENGEWELIEAEVSSDGKHLSFSVEEALGPFAIIVDTTSTSPDGPTGESNLVYIYAAMMVLSALALVVVILLFRRKKAAE